VLGIVTVLMAPLVGLFLLLESLSLVYDGVLSNLLDTQWYPSEDRYGLLPLLVGTVTTSGLALLVAVPLGLLMAIHLRFFASGRPARLAEAVIGALSGIPSVVFGLFGTFWIVPFLGASLLSAGLVLAMMVLPSFTLFALAALRQVPEGLLREGCALGLSRSTVITRLALRSARPGLIGAASLALARALGEALAVEMVAGNVPNIPTSLLDPVRTLTTTLVQEFEYAQGAHASALHLVALTVVALASLLTALAYRFGATQRTAPVSAEEEAPA